MKYLNHILLLLVMSLSFSSAYAWNSGNNSDNCNYGGNGGYNSPSCHVDIEERVSALEDNDNAGEKGDKGDRGYTGASGQDGLAGVDGTNGADGKNGSNGKNGTSGLNGLAGVDGMDGAAGSRGLVGASGNDGRDGTNGISQSYIRSVYKQYQKTVNQGLAEGAAIAALMQAPHDRSALSAGCSEYMGSTACAVGATYSIPNSNSLLGLSISENIRSVGYSYHFGQ